MQYISAGELLTAWERGAGQSAAARALTLLSIGAGGIPPDALAHLAVGRRNALLLELRESIFGPDLNALAPCPHCGMDVEATFDAAALREPGFTDGGDVHSLQANEYRVRFRLPHSGDLAAIDSADTVEEGRNALVARCVLVATRSGAAVDPATLPDDVVVGIGARLDQLDPLADARLSFTCPGCNRPFQLAFDIVSFLWGEINEWALRTMRQVHVLASAYGWREREILEMSAWRRETYLALMAE